MCPEFIQLLCTILSSLGTLPYLFQALFVLDEGLAPLILQLIYSALSGTPPTKEETPGPVETEPRSYTTSTRWQGGRKRETEEHRKAKDKGKEKEAKVTVVGKCTVRVSYRILE